MSWLLPSYFADRSYLLSQARLPRGPFSFVVAHRHKCAATGCRMSGPVLLSRSGPDGCGHGRCASPGVIKAAAVAASEIEGEEQ